MLAFTMWVDVGEGNLHGTLQSQESQTDVDNQPQELTRFTLRQNGGKRKSEIHT